jgi:hypothetical protein
MAHSLLLPITVFTRRDVINRNDKEEEMAKVKKRIRFRITLPSVALGNFWRNVIFDLDNFKLFMENTAGFLGHHGVRLDPSVNQDSLVQLRFTVARIRNYVVEEKVPVKQFENIFGIFTPETQLQDVSVFRETASDREVERAIESMAERAQDASTEVYYSEKQSESHRGSNTEWDKHDALSHSSSDHWSTTKFASDGKHIIDPDELFQRTPLLDIATLSRILTQMDIRLREFGNY